MSDSQKRREAMRALRLFGRPWSGSLAAGTVGTVGVVLMRLAIPWPLRGVIEVVFPDPSGAPSWVDHLPGTASPVLWLGLLYVVLAAGTGLAQVLQRVNMQRFASHTVHDLRAAAVRSVSQGPLKARAGSGDLITRIIGDTARIKAGISGILVHASQNGLLFLAVCGLMMYLSPALGMFFLVPGLIVLLYGWRTGAVVAKVADKQREKEGEYADAIHEGITHGGLDPGLEDINVASARKEVRTTRLMAWAGLVEHIVLALGVGVALWIGASSAASGALAPGDIFLFIAYALMVHRRMIQVGRQSARAGKVLAYVSRVYELITDEGLQPIERVPVPLETGLSLRDVKLDAVRGWGRRDNARLNMKGELTLKPGTKTAVIGSVGSGKSSLLRLLAGVESPDRGTLMWDDEDVTDRSDALLSRVSYLPQDPVFPPKRIFQLIGAASPVEPAGDEQGILEGTGAWQIIRRLPGGLNRKAASTDFTRNEARVLSLAGLLATATTSIWVLDNPLEGMRTAAARRCLSTALERAGNRTLIVALSRALALERFDRVLVVKRGKIAFDGTPAEWKEYKDDKARAKAV